MPKNEEGEFELILGNRQLLSVFFIVVVLLGVFFTMGYIVGRNSSPAPPIDTALKTDPKPIVVERASPGGPPADNSAAAPSVPVETPAPAPEPPPSAATTKTAEPPRPAATPEHKVEPKPEPASPMAGVPSPGATYLQLAAIGKAEAQVWVDVLAKKGFHALYSPVPEKSTFRVLVGPFPDAAAISEARSELTKAGFKGYEAIVRKY